jgi:adenine-specific DNA-methyltransferase
MATRTTKPKAPKPAKPINPAKSYDFPGEDEKALMRPDIGTQAQFKKKKEPRKYRYDSSLSPSLDWDGQNPAREQGEALIKEILDAQSIEQAKAAADKLRRISKPFLNWAGKAERLSFDVPTLPLFVHERLSTKAILETLKGHKRDKQLDMFDLFGDPGHSITDQVLKAYEHKDRWVNRMILGDSMVVMNSLLQYEGMGGKVQMIYMDPPYGVKFGSNFQPFVRKRDVTHGDDSDMTREPEMVQAYRDTWELGLHSYLTYLRDRLLVSRELLADSGSIFVQINDENVHYVRAVLDEVFGAGNCISQISFQTTSGFETSTIATLGDFLLWYAKDKDSLRIQKLFHKQPTVPGEGNARWIILPDGTFRGVSAAERRGDEPIPEGALLYKPDNILSQGAASKPQPFTFLGELYEPKAGSHWKANYPKGMERLAQAGRIHVARKSIQYRRYATDFPYEAIGNIWTDTITGSFTDDKIYAVQTNTKVVERCIMLATRPGDLVLDPTCGSGTTAYTAEGLGRRWITIDTSRVPIALARQRLLTATYDWYELQNEERGPSAGFRYQRRQNRKGEEVGGVVPHITLESIANDEPPKEEILIDRPETAKRIVRVTGAISIESTIPAPTEIDEHQGAAAPHDSPATFMERMVEILRKSPTLHTGDNKTLTLKNIRPPAKSLSLSAEGVAVNGDERAVAFVFGPENGAVTESLVFQSAREAYAKSYAHLFVIGFAVEAKARMFVQQCNDIVGIPATYVQATTDLTMSDLLKTMRSSQIFSVCGLPDVSIHAAKTEDNSTIYRAELLGMDVFDPVTMAAKHYRGDDAAEQDKVPAWFLDTDYNGLCFHVSQAFFPRTSAWDGLKQALKGTYDDSVWDHLAGTLSEPFEAGEHKQIAVKVIDDRGNELLVVKQLSEAVHQ